MKTMLTAAFTFALALCMGLSGSTKTAATTATVKANAAPVQVALWPGFPNPCVPNGCPTKPGTVQIANFSAAVQQTLAHNGTPPTCPPICTGSGTTPIPTRPRIIG